MQDIAKRVMVAVALPLLGCLLLAVLLGLQWREDQQRLGHVDALAELAVGVGAAVRALQDERGASAAALAGVPAFAELLPELRARSDRRLQQLGALLAQVEPRADDRELAQQLVTVEAALADLPGIRERVDHEATTPLAKMEVYTGLIRQLTATVNAVALDLGLPELAARLVTYGRLMAFIEYAARERGVGAALLGAADADATYRRSLLANIAAQRLLLEELRAAAPGTPNRQLYAIVTTSPSAAEREAFRGRLLEPRALAEADPAAAMAWFQLASAYLRELEQTLDLWAEELNGDTARLVARANAGFLTLILALLGLLAGLAWVSVAIGRRLVWQMAAERRDAEHIRYLSRHDPLTGLPNRYYFRDLLEEARRRTLADGKMLALHALDVVDFKEINRVWGIGAGDEAIRAVAARLRERLPENGELARMYGDQFALLQPAIGDKDEPEALARELLAAFEEPVALGERHVTLHVRVGITLYPPNAKTYDALVRNADLARQHVAAGGGYTFYISQMYERYTAAKALVRDLRHAADAGEFRLVYQPKLDLATRRLSGVEALIRWQHPRRGLLGPGQFIAEAERSGQIVGIGAWALAEVCRQLHRWREAGLRTPSVAVNLSPVQLRDAELLALVSDEIRRCGIEADALELEVTESALIGDLEASLVTLQRLRELGVSLAIDDFGTGYSSLTYLQRMPANRVKLDRSFITPLETSSQSRQIVDAVIHLSHGLGMRVVAEGVETERQLELLRRKGCDEVQGFLVSQPLPADELAVWLR